uniref:KIB1-4 beta-propeller domain-containing protein n=1 Tax=Oryza glumipatula TaxID=40148 RepID=A0A0D9YFN4_9ORYZ
MAASPPWANLIGALVREIATRLPCKFDRVHFAAVCRSWRESLEQLAPLPRDYATHPAVVPDWVRYARYIGAYDDGWVFLSTAPPQGPQHHLLLDTYQFDRHINLPDAFIEHHTGALLPLSIVAAALSFYPDVDGRCVFAGIINVGPVPQGRPMIAFWRIFDPVVPGLFSGPLNPRREWDAVDVVHHHGAFHFLTQGEHIIVAKPEFHYWCPVPAMPQVDWEFRCFPSNRRGYNQQHVKARYLVKSREDLLMVVRCSPHPGQPTSAFKVFRMVPSQRARCRQYIWQRVPSLGGRMLFVGRGCSRSYEADHYPAGIAGGIYFFDDGFIQDPRLREMDGITWPHGGALLPGTRRIELLPPSPVVVAAPTSIACVAVVASIRAATPLLMSRNVAYRLSLNGRTSPVTSHRWNSPPLGDVVVLHPSSQAPARRLAAPQPATTSATAAARLSRYCAGAESPRQTLRASARAVVGEIANHLPCEFDCVHFAAVCRSWRASLEQQAALPLPPALPVLILPLAERPAVSCVLSNCAIHPAVLPEWPHDARYIGAYDDGWVILSIAPPRDSRPHIDLPTEFIAQQDGAPGQEWQLPFSIVAATLSSQPDVDGCVFAGIISVDPVPRGQRTIGFWRASDRVIPHLFQTHNPPWDVEDVPSISSPKGSTSCHGPDFHGGDPVDWEMRAFEHIGREYDQYVEARYLVESREDLLMVVRCSPYPGQPTSEFRVFRMAQAGPDDVFPYQHYVWLELPSLEGRMLFVGRGCSRSYDADQYPGFEGGVYFFDDDIQDPAMLPLGVATLFSFNDCGKWTKNTCLHGGALLPGDRLHPPRLMNRLLQRINKRVAQSQTFQRISGVIYIP